MLGICLPIVHGRNKSERTTTELIGVREQFILKDMDSFRTRLRTCLETRVETTIVNSISNFILLIINC